MTTTCGKMDLHVQGISNRYLVFYYTSKIIFRRCTTYSILKLFSFNLVHTEILIAFSQRNSHAAIVTSLLKFVAYLIIWYFTASSSVNHFNNNLYIFDIIFISSFIRMSSISEFLSLNLNLFYHYQRGF